MIAWGIMDTAMEFRLLGPVEVIIGGRPVPLSAPRQKAVLTLLLVECGKVVSVSRLVDLLWPKDPPSTARSQVQITISALRRLIGGKIIRTRSPGYVIDVSPDAIDYHRYERLVAEAAAVAESGRLECAVHLLRRALALWSGFALEGVRGDAILAMAARMNERRMFALQNCLQFELELGRHEELVGELREHVAGNPFNERLRGLLALALYRGGRQPDALRALREGRELLADEMGLDPGGELRRLEHAILTGDSRLGLAEPRPAHESPAAGSSWVPRQLPRAASGFTGRDELISRISALLSPECGTKASDVPIAVLTGRGGMGKTALAVRVAHLVSESFPDGQLFIQLHSNVHQTAGEVLAGLLRLAGFREDLIPLSPGERSGLFRSWLAGRRVLIVIDDVVDASAVTLFLPGAPGCAVIVTSRHRLTLEGAVHYEIGPLDELAAFDLLTHLLGRHRVNGDVDAVTRLIALCDSMPLALCAVGAKLAARPHWPVSRMAVHLQDHKRRLGELELGGASVRTTIALSYRGLEPRARCLLRRLSLLNTGEFAAWIAAPLLGSDLHRAEEALQQLVDAHLVEAFICEHGPVRFCLHDLVRIYAAERLEGEETNADQTGAIRRTLEAWLCLARAARGRGDAPSADVVPAQRHLWSLPPDVMHWVIGDGGADWLRAEHASLTSAIVLAVRYGFHELGAELKAAAPVSA